jgi:RNA polymerase sigma-70 factor, ECF subfamily
METAGIAVKGGVNGSMYFSKAQDLVTSGLDDLYQQHAAMVFRTALRVTGNPADAEDVLQTVFLRILDHQLQLNPVSAAEPYLRRAATNASIDLLRRKTKRAESEFKDSPKQDSHKQDSHKYGSKENTLLLKERLRRALANQPPENAELFVMCYLEGCSYDELAEQYKVERGTIASRLHRIRAAIRKDLGE